MPDEVSPEQAEEAKRRAIESAREQLPCSNCGSNEEPVLAKSKRGTARPLRARHVASSGHPPTA